MQKTLVHGITNRNIKAHIKIKKNPKRTGMGAKQEFKNITLSNISLSREKNIDKKLLLLAGQTLVIISICSPILLKILPFLMSLYCLIFL